MANNSLLDLGGSATWTSAAFTLLEQIHLTPTKEFYSTHAEEVQTEARQALSTAPGRGWTTAATRDHRIHGDRKQGIR